MATGSERLVAAPGGRKTKTGKKKQKNKENDQEQQNGRVMALMMEMAVEEE
jgi:hypothetical protein